MQCATVPSRAVLSTFDAFTHFRCRAHGNGTWVALPDDVFMPEIQSLRNREVARLLHSSGGGTKTLIAEWEKIIFTLSHV